MTDDPYLSRSTPGQVTEIAGKEIHNPHDARSSDCFRQRALPVVLVNVTGGAPGRTQRQRTHEPRPAGWTDLIPEMDQQPGDILVTKRTWGAFASTDDAMTDVRREAHDYSIANVFPRLGETGTTQDIIDLLGKMST